MKEVKRREKKERSIGGEAVRNEKAEEKIIIAKTPRRCRRVTWFAGAGVMAMFSPVSPGVRHCCSERGPHWKTEK